MTINLKSFLLVILVVIGIWFLYVERAILTPFILAGIFAFLFNPVVDFFSERLKFPRTLSILVIYLILISIFVFGSLTLTSRIIEESSDLRTYTNQILSTAHSQLQSMPDWLRPTAYDLLFSLRRSKFINFFEAPSFFPFFSQAISRVISFLIFLFSAFYFLKDGKNFFTSLMNNFPTDNRKDIKVLFNKINLLLGGYLRGQIFLIFLMSIATYIALAILGIRFAAIIAIFSGFAEIIPVIGPITAGAVAVGVILFTGTANFGLSAVNASLIVAAIYFILRQLEDYFVIPYVMGKITQLPPFVIFFSVIAGGHLAGLLGLVIAVPTVAILKLLLEFYFQSVDRKDKS
ncbi:MAG TPA: AI-2E family transporter [Patescibacteria group bacterium]